MSSHCLLLTIVGILSGAISAQSSSPPASLKVAGKEYVRVSDWARAEGLKSKTLGKGAEVSNPSTKFTFTADSRETRANGVTLWLSFPAVLHDGTFYLSRLDLQTTLRPLLSPPKNPAGIELKSVCL